MANYLGTTKRIKATFKDKATGALIDPDTVTLLLFLPDRSELTYVYGVDAALKRLSTGIYYLDITWSQAGTWLRRWEAVVGSAVGKLEPPRIQVVSPSF